MPLRVRLRNQLEFLFADGNYSKDVHLQLLQRPDGYTPLDKIVVTYTGIGSSLLRPDDSPIVGESRPRRRAPTRRLRAVA